jgi:hypothetical protein
MKYLFALSLLTCVANASDTKLVLDDIGVYDSLSPDMEVVRVKANGCTTDITISKKEFQHLDNAGIDKLVDYITKVVLERNKNGCK